MSDRATETLKQRSATPARLPDFVEPMKAKLVGSMPTGDWIYEIKFDGYRALALRGGSDTRLLSRNEKDLGRQFPEVKDAVAALNVQDVVIDGEIVALDDKGRSSFQLLQGFDMGLVRPPIVFYAFDLLRLNGKDLQNLPIEERKAKLEELLKKPPGVIRYSVSFTKDIKELLGRAQELGLEGLIGKPEGSRKYFGALLVGFYEGKSFKFAGRVGTGFSEKLLRTIYDIMQEIRLPACPFANLPEKRRGRWGQGITPAIMKRCHWVEPVLVAQVKFTEWTSDDQLRQPVFLGLRTDKPATDVVRE